ncbi:hypothetical protein HYW35_01775 [Candidatus Saccharibacteria bacterium]|nr:hypothetical protein [Candidatus Saccharibacteria bacterium]
MDKKMIPIIMIVMALTIAGIIFAGQGYVMQKQVAPQEARFHQLQTSYYSLSKADRDSAPTGSELNNQLAQIQNYPSELLRLKLVGVGKILTGIFSSLVAILIVLFMMPIRLGAMMRPSARQ